jgi:hypothetical protein
MSTVSKYGLGAQAATRCTPLLLRAMGALMQALLGAGMGVLTGRPLTLVSCVTIARICEHYDLCEQPNHVIGALVGGFPMWRNIDGIPKSCERVYGHGQPHTRQPAWGNCHSFLRDGRWQFLGDSAHSLAGQTVNMIPLPKLWAADANE